MNDPFLASVLEEYARRKRERETISKIILSSFVLDPKGKTKRSEVYACVAKELRRPVSNDLCVLVRSVLEGMNVIEAVSNGRARFLGLSRMTRESPLPVG